MSTLHAPTTPLLRWGLVFLACPLDLGEEQRRGLVLLAARAWFEDEPVIAFDWPDLHGELRAVGEVATLGPFVGQRFEARVDGAQGAATVAFLVTEAQLMAARQPVPEA